MKQSPIFTKTYDFLLWLLNYTEHYPKDERFRLAKRIEDSAYQVYELFMRAARSRDTHSILREADFELERLRLYLRLSHARKRMTDDQYAYAAAAVVEIGKLLGGWIKTLPASGV